MLTQLLKISCQYSYLPNKQFCPNKWVPYPSVVVVVFPQAPFRVMNVPRPCPSIPNRQDRPAFLGIYKSGPDRISIGTGGQVLVPRRKNSA